MRIGFYGDSFCQHKFSIFNKTYISLLEDHYAAKVIHLGYGGSSHWDLIINQFKTPLPDVCVFCWTDSNRLFHPTIRHIRYTEALNYSQAKSKFNATYDFGMHKKTWQAAQAYYEELYDQTKTNIEYISSLYYFDHQILGQYNNTKFIHLWSFGNPTKWYNDSLSDTFAKDNLSYPYRWSHGMEIRPSMMSLATRSPTASWDDFQKAVNHIPTKEVNVELFNKIKYCIDNYQPGILI